MTENTDTTDSTATTDDDATTKSTRTRWELTGTVTSLLLVLTVCASVLLYVVRGLAVPIWATSTLGLATLAAVAWAFGESAYRAATQTKK